MSHRLKVSLDTSVTPHVLEIDDHGHLHVDKKPGVQIISWHLTGVLKRGAFVPMDHQQPGFQWLGGPPPAKVFGKPVLGIDGGLSLIDRHENATSDGSWVYRLRVDYDGQVYETTGDAAQPNLVRDPIIINH